MTKVNCSVKSCEHWGKEGICQAESIWIKNDKQSNDVSGLRPDDYNPDDFNEADTEFAKPPGEALAKNSSQTCCKTMQLQNNG